MIMIIRVVPFIMALLLAGPAPLIAQSATTETLQRKYKDALQLFFYNNTLKMLNQQGDSKFDELIKDIEKMRFLLIKKAGGGFSDEDFKRLVADYKAEAFEEVMTSRHQGKHFDIYIKEKAGKTNGMLVLINDAQNLYVLDILGRIALDKVTRLYQTLDESADIGRKIKAFTGDDEDGEENKPSSENR